MRDPFCLAIGKLPNFPNELESCSSEWKVLWTLGAQASIPWRKIDDEERRVDQLKADKAKDEFYRLPRDSRDCPRALVWDALSVPAECRLHVL